MLSRTKKVELINKYNFIEAAPDGNSNTFVILIAVFGAPKSFILTNFLRDLLFASLQQKKTLSEVSRKYIEYKNVFLLDLVIELPENTKINKNVIKIVKGKLPLYTPIYSFCPIELEMLKKYFKIYLKKRFI